jgi:hypothetical protein
MTQNNMLSPLQNMPQPYASAIPSQPPKQNWLQKIASGAGNFFFGNPGGVEQYSTVTPDQQNVLQLLQQLGIQGLQNPYAGFAPIAQQAVNQFNQQTVPSLAERFTSLGNGALSSPAFASQLGQANAGLQSDLAAMQAGYGQQNIQQALQLLQLALRPQSENLHKPRESGLVQNLLGAAPSFYQSYQMGNILKSLQR